MSSDVLDVPFCKGRISKKLPSISINV